MQTNTTTGSKKRGRPSLSPNNLVNEFKEKKKKKAQTRRDRRKSRCRTELRKRCNDRLRQKRRKMLRRHGLQEPLGATVRKRMKAVRYYQHWRERFSESEAALRAGQKHAVSIGTIRRWARLYREHGFVALLPKKSGPVNAPNVIPLKNQFLVVALRRLFGWNEKRIAKELQQRGLAQLSHTAVGNIFRRYFLPTRTYHSKACCDGIPKRRYEKSRPNQQWHIDFAETKLQDGNPVRIVVLLDDYSRYCLQCTVVPDMTTETAIQTVQTAWQEFGLPEEIVSDNGAAFTSVHEHIPTAFGRLLQHKGICHRLITPYWPEGNGKAEAFVKIVKHECLNHLFSTVPEMQQALADFVLFYNHFRLHGSLDFQTPVSRLTGIPTFLDHGLVGIPRLPNDLVMAFPPSHPVHLPSVNILTVKQRFALASFGC